MNKTVKFLAVCASVALLSACGKDDEKKDSSNCSTKCDAELQSGETAQTVPAAAKGTHKIKCRYSNTGSPFALGTEGTFVVKENRVVISIDGKCVDAGNPFTKYPGSTEASFRDNCTFNLIFAVSVSGDKLNEINVMSASGTFLAQFGYE